MTSISVARMNVIAVAVYVKMAGSREYFECARFQNCNCWFYI